MRALAACLVTSILVALSPACGSPDNNQDIMCGPNGECPLGFECDPKSRRCVTAGSLGGKDAGADAAAARDAAAGGADAAAAAADAPRPPDAAAGGADARITGPTVTISSPAPGATTGGAVRVSFSSTESVTRFECAVDSGAFAACGSGTSGQTDVTLATGGSHTVSVRAVDAAGNTGAAASVTFTVDLSGPTFTLGTISAPPDSGDVSVAYTASETPASVSCALDGAACATCAATAARCSGASAGEHVFTVQGTDALGNQGPPASSQPFTVSYGPNAGHAILIGHDYLTSNAETEALLRNAFAQVPYRVRGLFTRGLRVAVFQGATADPAEAKNALAAVGTVVEKATTFTGAANLATALRGKDLLLVVDQQDPTGIDAVGAAWGSTLHTFLDRGGVVVVLDGLVGATTTPSRTFAALSGGVLQIASSAAVGAAALAVRLDDANDLLNPDDVSPLSVGSSYAPPASSVIFSLDAKENGVPRAVYVPNAGICTIRVCPITPVVLDKVFPIYFLTTGLGSTISPQQLLSWSSSPTTDYSRLDCTVTNLSCQQTGSAPSCDCGGSARCPCLGDANSGLYVPFVTAGTYRVDLRLVDPYGSPGRSATSTVTIDLPTAALTPSSIPNDTGRGVICYRGSTLDRRRLSYALTFNGNAVNPDATTSTSCSSSDSGSYTFVAVCNNVVVNPPQNSFRVDVADGFGNTATASVSWVLNCIL